MRGARVPLGRRRSAHPDRRRREEHPPTLAVCLEGLGGEALAVGTGDAALAAHRPAALRPRLPRPGAGRPRAASTCSRSCSARRPDLAIVVITAYATFETAVEAMRRGARDYLPKPFTPAQIRHLIEKVRTRAAPDRQGRRAGAAAGRGGPRGRPRQPVGRPCARCSRWRRASPPPTRRCCSAARTAPARACWRAPSTAERARREPLRGHQLPDAVRGAAGQRAVRPRRGAFTGAVRDQPGRVEAAEGGTLFLDEIGEIPPALQGKLLRFLQEKEFERVGETRTRHADVRVVAATNRDLEADVKAGRFREDLLYRLNVVEVRCRRCASGARTSCRWRAPSWHLHPRDAARCAPELSPAAEKALEQHAWPGNVRELRNAIERADPLAGRRSSSRRRCPSGCRARRQRRPTVGGDFTARRGRARAHPARARAGPARLEDAARAPGRSTPRRCGASARSTKGRTVPDAAPGDAGPPATDRVPRTSWSCSASASAAGSSSTSGSRPASARPTACWRRRTRSSSAASTSCSASSRRTAAPRPRR